MDIRIGTSGYSFDDWKGAFYPSDIPKGKLLDFYVGYFNTVEINSTYYRIFDPSVAANMVKKAPEGFEFLVKAHSSFTHQRDEAPAKRDQYLASIEAFRESNTLSGILAQFPYSFKFSGASLEHVLSAKQYFAEIPVYIEFRHTSWSNNEVFVALRDAKLGWVSVDLPKLPNLPDSRMVVSTDTAYIRLHGRNAEAWYDGGDRRYDYNYSEDDLKDWQAKLDSIRKKSSKAYVFFNNCYRGQAVRNAQQMIELFKL